MTEQPATMLRGSKIRIWPNKRQTASLDLWRRRCISLWNLLLELEQAAYSGENRKSRLRWRSIWAQVMEDSHAEAVRVAREGKMRKDGTYRKEPGARQEPPPLDEAMLGKIRRQTQETDPETGEALPAKLFMWEHELQKIMARLKKVPRTEWIADLPSHAAQAVVKDLIRALQAMLRERKKRASGAGGRDTGFPKFKKSRYAAGSVYFANTQLKFDFEKNRVQLPGGCGWMPCEIPIAIRLDAQSNTTWRPKLMGGRAWREGEKWFLSCQWEMRKPPALPATGRTAGVKIAASVLLTTYDDRGQIKEYFMPPPDKKLVAQHRLAGKRLALIIAGQTKKAKKIEARKVWQRAKAEAAGKTVKPLGRARVKRSAAFFKVAARLANLEAAERNARDDVLHKVTTEVLHKFDAISVQKMNVAGLMKKPSARLRRREARRLKQEAGAAKRRDLKPVRKLMRHVAMARCGQMLEYKFKDLRGAEAYQEIDPHDVNVTACSSCGTVHPAWKDGRRIVRCNAVLPDGSECGTHLPRNRNAARVSKRVLDRRRKQAETA
jgi:transposase